jgi:hypothetical protein
MGTITKVESEAGGRVGDRSNRLASLHSFISSGKLDEQHVLKVG